MDWLDFLAVEGTLKSLLQHHSLKTSVLQCSVFFMVQLSHPYMMTGKTIALTVQREETEMLLGFKITVDSDCSHEIKRHLFPGRKVVINKRMY